MAEKEDRKGPDEVIYELGGCGRFQIQFALMIHTMNIVIVWCLNSMIFITAVPKWRCTNEQNTTEATDNTFEEKCIVHNGTECSSFEFSEDMHTIVDEWNLVCDTAWIPSAINSIQIGFILLGNFLSGHIADTIGRKMPIFGSLIVLIVCNVISSFSVSWVMFMICRMVIGLGTGLFLTVRYNYMSEFTLARWRAWLIGAPSWSIEACLLAPVLFWLKDWRSTQLAISIVGIPFLALWWFIPESFRWYYAHDRIEEAEKVITTMSELNHRPVPDMTYMKQLVMASLEESKRDRKYSFLDLFKSIFLLKVTVLLSLNWFALGIIGYGISFGIQNLAGSIYLNLFIFPAVEIPARFIQPWLLNKVGRRTTCIGLYVFTGIAAFIVGIVQYIETAHRDALTRWFALAANLGISSTWPTVQTMTVETYPTVVRNIGFGFCSVFARVGATLGPQLAFLDTSIAGILYFICGVVCTVCLIGLFWLPETRDSNLSDRLNEDITHEQTHEEPHQETRNKII